MSNLIVVKNCIQKANWIKIFFYETTKSPNNIMLLKHTTKSLFPYTKECIALQIYPQINRLRSYSKKFGKKRSSCSSNKQGPTCKFTIRDKEEVKLNDISDDAIISSETTENSSNALNLQDMFCVRTPDPTNKLMDYTKLKSISGDDSRAKYSTKISTSCNPGRHRYHEECECALNQQVFAELNAGLAYLSMSCYFGRSDIALPGCHGFFLKMYEEEMGHAMQFINYQLMRGGKVQWFPITIPDSEEFNCVVKAFSVATEMEKVVKEKIQCVHDLAEKHKDLAMMDLMVDFLDEQDKSICEMARLLVRAKKMCEEATGEYLFDRELFNGWVRKFDKTSIYK